ncbi:MAG TPA: UbiA family prenyltransferase [Candidatus Saccharimonadales bacterium]|nr:UbiA family prenyltransferase [Candidatus Saccharimonadales bacterium]
MRAAIRLIHPAPAAAVVALTAALGAILAAQAGVPIGERWVLTVLAVAGSQVFTGATNDIADQERDGSMRPEKPIPAGELSLSAATWIASAGLAVQLVASWWLGPLPLALGAVATASALTYNLALSRTPFSPLPYVVSFGLLPAWVAAGVGVPLERILPAIPLVAPFAVAAHLANTLRDWQSDAIGGSRSLAQVLGRQTSRRLAVLLGLAVGVGVGTALLIGGGATLPSVGLGVIGLLAIVLGWWGERQLWYGVLIAAVCWTAAWALATG